MADNKKKPVRKAPPPPPPPNENTTAAGEPANIKTTEVPRGPQPGKGKSNG